MNGNTIDHIEEFLKGKAELPPNVRLDMVLMAIKIERDARKEDHQELLAQVTENKDALIGKDGKLKEGLSYRVDRLEGIVRFVIWAVSPIVLAFLGGVGLFVFNQFFS